MRSGRGAVSVFRPVRFRGPPPEPDVRLSPHPALHKSRWTGSDLHAAVGQGFGILVPRYR
ncbi:hypothetical protein DLJ47_11755 [Micromonospora sp. S4605]|nr:hypothetical protein DLJ47_11755 [Micromonospora sp. S4605]